jgi:hypothetical protein
LCCCIYCLFCVVLCIVFFFFFTVLLPPGGYSIVVKYINIIIYHHHKYCPVFMRFPLRFPNNFIMKCQSSEILHLCEKFVVTFLPKRRNKLIILHAVISCNIYCERLKTYLL